MGSIRVRKETSLLMFDFRYRGVRCREQSALTDTADNRKKMEKVMRRIEAEITLGSFDYAKYFPHSSMQRLFNAKSAVTATEEVSGTPLFKDFIWEWYDENTIRWKYSYRETLKVTFNRYLIPAFGNREISHITKGELLKFRSSLAKVQNGTKTGLSPDRINHVMTPLRMVLAEAAERYNFVTPFVGIKQLRVPKAVVDPLSLEEVIYFLANVRPDYKNYYSVRFYSGMRTSEIDGLKWKYVNFERREIFVRETIVFGRVDTAKTIGSERTIQMTQPVFDALQSQFVLTGKHDEFVFCNASGSPFNYHNINNRVWLPTLKRLQMKRRTAYQSRHTAATIWLACGENPEWIARQLGHTSTKMLFSVYSRFVPNITHLDGTAFERLLAQHGQEVSNEHR